MTIELSWCVVNTKTGEEERADRDVTTTPATI